MLTIVLVGARERWTDRQTDSSLCQGDQEGEGMSALTTMLTLSSALSIPSGPPGEFRAGPSPSVNPLWRCPHSHTRVVPHFLVSLLTFVVLNLITLTVETSDQTRKE